MWFSGRLTLCVAAYSHPHALCVLPTLIIVNGLGTRLVPALQECHDVTCHCYRYLSHQADVTCRLLHLPAFATILWRMFLVDILHNRDSQVAVLGSV